MGVIPEKRLKNFFEFEEEINILRESIAQIRAETKLRVIPDHLFRGQSNALWGLETTLERHLGQYNFNTDVSWQDYATALHGVNIKVSSLTNNKYEVNWQDACTTPNELPPFLDFMVYLRHHGFPSPFLDWSKSPYVAAFFAYADADPTQDVAIYTYQESKDGCGSWIVSEPHITAVGNHIKTHPRHHIQQCEYTLCHKTQDRQQYYCPIKDGNFSDRQNIVKKYILPANEKFDVLARLHLMNINKFTLFSNEDGLMHMLSTQFLRNLSS